MRHFFTVLFCLTTLAPFLITANPANAEGKKVELTKVAKITSWLSAPKDSTMSDIFETAKGLEEDEILELVSSIEGLPLSYKIMLSGLIARHDNFDKIYATCLERAANEEKAICFAAYREWNHKRNQVLKGKEQMIAVELFDTKDLHTQQMMAITLSSLGVNFPETFSQLISILEHEAPGPNEGYNLPYNMALLTLESLTDTTTNRLDNKEKIAHFEKWKENNFQIIWPIEEFHDGKNMSYINRLHRISLKLPSAFRSVIGVSYVQGRRCYFADDQMRSISVETHPKIKGLKPTYEQMKTILEVTKQEETPFDNHPAIKFTGNVSEGQVVGVLIELDDRYMFATVHSRNEDDTVEDLEGILSSLSVL